MSLFYKRRTGLLEHLEKGKLSLYHAGLHDFLCLMASQSTDDPDNPPGVWIGSAAAIAVACPRGADERQIQRGLEHLEQMGWIKTWKVQGRRGNYPIMLERFEVRSSAGKTFLVSAADTTDWQSPILHSCGERGNSARCARSDSAVSEVVTEARKGIKQESRNSPSAPSGRLPLAGRNGTADRAWDAVWGVLVRTASSGSAGRTTAERSWPAGVPLLTDQAWEAFDAAGGWDAMQTDRKPWLLKKQMRQAMEGR